MKKMCLVLAVMMLASSAFSAEVLSQNAVGFISIPMEADELQALTYPFYVSDSDSGIKWTDTPIAKAAAYGSTVYFWYNGRWTQSIFTEGEWGAPDEWSGMGESYTLQSGEMFFYRPSEAQDVLISGEVPDEDVLPVIAKAGGFLSAVANPYPTPVKFTDSKFAENAPYGASAYFWYNGRWTQSIFTEGEWGAPDEWSGMGESFTIEPGRGIFFRTIASSPDVTNTFTRPYTWPDGK